MVRNAGGRVFDALRTLAVLQTIGQPGTIAVMHHTGMVTQVGCRSSKIAILTTEMTDCGMTHFHDSKIREALLEIAPGDGEAIKSTKFGEVAGSIEESVREDLAILRNSPWIREGTQLVGLKYEIETGKLTLVE